MTTALDATGVVVLNASGPASGQTVRHLHFHVVPCWADDGATYWPADRSDHRLEGDVRARLAEKLSSST
jgi:histidine triad (HIT) family protein